MNAETRERIGCPEGVNPRYWVFALDVQPDTWEGNIEYMSWINRKSQEFRKLHPETFVGGNLYDQDAYDAWLVSQVEITPERRAKAEQYFEKLLTSFSLERRQP